MTESFDELYELHVGICNCLGIEPYEKPEKQIEFEEFMSSIISMGLVVLAKEKNKRKRGEILCMYIAACMTIAVLMEKIGGTFLDLITNDDGILV